MSKQTLIFSFLNNDEVEEARFFSPFRQTALF